MTLTPEQIRLREGKVTASFVPYLMAGKTERIRSEWMKLVGHEAHTEPDWSEMWNLHYGSLIEPLALDWHEKKTGMQLKSRGKVVNHFDLPHVCCTLDAWRVEDNCVIDCKAWSSWQKVDYICSFLTPQLIVQKACMQAKNAAILLVHGGTEPVEYPLSWSDEYEAQVWARIDEFWQCVVNLVPPVDMGALSAPIPAVREVDMSGSNAWGKWSGDWLSYRPSATIYNSATKELKELMPRDAYRAYGHGVEITRAKNGNLTVREAKT